MAVPFMLTWALCVVGPLLVAATPQLAGPDGRDVAVRALGDGSDDGFSAWVDRSKPFVEAINAVTLATSDMASSYAFYSALGLACTFGGPAADFSTFGSGGGPAGGDNRYHINLFVSPGMPKPPIPGGWNGWGRAIFYVSDVDAFHAEAVAAGLKPEFPPRTAPWGERYFQVLDPMGHELSFARPVPAVASEMTARHV